MDPLYFVTLYLAAWAVLYVLARFLKAEKRGLTVRPLYFIYKTTSLNKSLEWISNLSPMGWRALWNIGAAMGLGQMILAVYFLGRNAVFLAEKNVQAGPVQPIVPIPGLGISWENFPHIMIALVILLVTHEFGHGIASLIDRVPLKSTGVFFAAVIPGGFVEPDEEKLQKAKTVTKLRVYAAGSSSNVFVALIFILLLFNFTATISPFYQRDGVSISSIRPNFPADMAGLMGGDVIYSINGTKVAGVDDLRNYMVSVHPGSHLALSTSRGDRSLVVVPESDNSTRALIGISPADHFQGKLSLLPSDLPNQILRFEMWGQLIVLSVALLNMLPLYPLDGDKFLDTLLRAAGVKWSKELRSIASSACLIILALNFGLSYYRFGYVRF